jgi:gamma-glutamylcyclotransferase (GGCT)/AIG2-like uncharacterized protein YtfP
MSTAHGFTYGSLMFDEVMRAVADQQGLVSIPATLKGWERFAIRNASYPAARRGKPQASIRGVLWLDLSESAWKRLDAFEGDAYRRAAVEVHCDSGMHPAWVYEFLDPGLLLPQDWDEATFRQQHLADFFRQHGAHLS